MRPLTPARANPADAEKHLLEALPAVPERREIPSGFVRRAAASAAATPAVARDEIGTQLESRSQDDLYKMAKFLRIDGRSTMSRDQLLGHIRAAL